MLKLDNALLYNKCLSKESEKNENRNTTYQNIWNSAKIYQISFVLKRKIF